MSGDDYAYASLQPSYWGYSFWKMMHCTAAGYPEHPTDTDRLMYKAFFSSFMFVLPCQKCAERYARQLQTEYPLTDEVMANTLSLSRWVFDIHNATNDELGQELIDWRSCELTYLNPQVWPPQPPPRLNAPPTRRILKSRHCRPCQSRR